MDSRPPSSRFELSNLLYARMIIPRLPAGRCSVSFQQHLDSSFLWPGTGPFPIVRTLELNLVDPVAVNSLGRFGQGLLGVLVLGIGLLGLARRF